MAAPDAAGTAQARAPASAHAERAKRAKRHWGKMRPTADDVPDGVGTDGEGYVACGLPWGGSGGCGPVSGGAPEANFML